MTTNGSVHDTDCDLLVAGSGAAGLAAAVTAAAHGLKVMVVEKSPVIGGTTAWSGGWIWAPGNSLAGQSGIADDPGAPERYLSALLGNRFNPERIRSFRTAAPQMVDFFHQRTALQFDGGFPIPDTYGDLPGAGLGGRSVIARPYDARLLGDEIALLRAPLAETTFKGMTIQAGADLRAFMTMTRSANSMAYVAGRVLRHASDLAIHGRAMQLRNGSALVARLLRSALDLGIAFRTETSIESLMADSGRITGARLSGGNGDVRARSGVVLACGGFPHDPMRRASTLPRNSEHLTLAVPTATGDGLRLAESVGAHVETALKQPAAYCPVSRVRWPNGDEGVFPHIIDRGKPGLIGVLANGKRFCNEGLGYHDYVEALLGAVPPSEPARSWLVCDHRFLRRYGLGIVRPAPLPWKPWTKTGYLKSAPTIHDLATRCGIDPDGLTQTVEHWNAGAARGEDPQYNRGTTPYMRLQGDSKQKPNPCVAPILHPPFHAVEVVPGSFGTFAGIATDAVARVLRADGRVVDGLYAAGTDAASVFGGYYPAGGINLGPALTFGFIAGRHAASKDTT